MDESATFPDESERWLPVVDWEGLYEVSSLGRVRSLPRAATSGRILKTPCCGDYLAIHMSGNGRQQFAKIHTLVARAFLGPCPEGLEICHGPGGRLDNSVTNLSYGTPSRNNGEDKWRDGTMQAGAKLTDETVLECRVRAAKGEQIGTLAREFGVTYSAAYYAISGRSWKHVPFPDAAQPPAA